MVGLDPQQLLSDYESDGVVRIRSFLSAEDVAGVREEIESYVREDLESKPADAATLEADGATVRNLWRLEQHCPGLLKFAESEDVCSLISPLVKGTPDG